MSSRGSIRFLTAVAVLLGAVWLPVGFHPTPAHAIAYKHITISLYRQRRRAWDGNTVVLSTLVTTGNPALPTPTGWYTIYARFGPFTFVSPWPHGSRFWYPTSRVSFALECLHGYFIDGAPWRSVLGTGGNRAGQPGTNYGGTHGCVNVPDWAGRFLYDWAPLGMPVHIIP